MSGATAERAPADLDRRFYAFVVDRLVVGVAAGVAAFLVLRHPAASGRPMVVAAAVVGCAVAVGGALAVAVGVTGSSPGRAAARLRLVDARTGAPLGVTRALRRQLLLGLATVPTFGLGAMALAWTAVADPGGRRHGWHDRVTGSEVVDVRRPAVEEPEPANADRGPGQVVNLTALRLVPVPAAVPVAPSAGRPRPPARLGRHAGRAPARWRVGFDTGESLEVAGSVLVGRDPTPRPGEHVRQLVALRSEALSLSKTHAQLRLSAGGVLEVVDRGSTNGSLLRRRGAVRELPAGRPTTLLDGDVVVFGDREMRVSAAR